MFWIGEMLIFAFVVGPYARSLKVEERSGLFQAIGRKSLPYAWGAIILLLITGLLNLAYMHIPLASLVTPAFYRTTFGTYLDIKLLAVLGMLIVTVLHDVYVAGRNRQIRRDLARGQGGREKLVGLQARYRKLASRLGQLNLLLALIVVFCAVGLVI